MDEGGKTHSFMNLTTVVDPLIRKSTSLASPLGLAGA